MVFFFFFLGIGDIPWDLLSDMYNRRASARGDISVSSASPALYLAMTA